MPPNPDNPINLEHAAGDHGRYVYVPEPIIRCPECSSDDTRSNGTRRPKGEEANRRERFQYRVCRSCGHSFIAVFEPTEIL